MRAAEVLLFAFGTVTGCSVFDESMRRPKSDAGASSASGMVPSSTAAAPSTSAPPSPLTCSVDAPEGSGTPACGGVGGERGLEGRAESEPNDTSPEMLTRDALVCGTVAGADVDTFQLPVAGGDCLDVFAQLDGASATLHVPGEAASLTFDETTDRAFSLAQGAPSWSRSGPAAPVRERIAWWRDEPTVPRPCVGAPDRSPG
jgi:hypothetical protein